MTRAKAAVVADPDSKPTRAETQAIEAFKAARETRAPRMKVSGENVRPDHPSRAVAQIALMKAIGTTDGDSYSGLQSQLINVGSPGRLPDEAGTNFMLAIVKGIQPRDQIEAMLAAQLGAVHLATITFARRLAHVENIPQQDSAERTFNKLARTFAAQVEALKAYRTKGEQRMVVQHVNVAGGGQAIVGNVNGPAEEGAPVRKSEEQPAALANAPDVETPHQMQDERAAMSGASGSGFSGVPHAPGQRRRLTATSMP
jgi:hypothetical protein